MYNDYYLQEISNKLSETNNSLDTIISNQQNSLHNEELLISGEYFIVDHIELQREATLVGVTAFVLLTLLYFIVRVFK